MILLSKSIKYMRRFVWTHQGLAVKGHFRRDGRNFVNFLLPCVWRHITSAVRTPPSRRRPLC